MQHVIKILKLKEDQIFYLSKGQMITKFDAGNLFMMGSETGYW